MGLFRRHGNRRIKRKPGLRVRLSRLADALTGRSGRLPRISGLRVSSLRVSGLLSWLAPLVAWLTALPARLRAVRPWRGLRDSLNGPRLRGGLPDRQAVSRFVHRGLHAGRELLPDRDLSPGPEEAAARGPVLPPRGIDIPMLGAMLALLGLGIVMVYSSSAVFAGTHHHSAFYFVKRHLAYCLAGLVALYVGWRIDYGFYRKWAYPMLLGTLVMLALLLVPGLGTHVDGATRWFRVGGISIQPSEPAKLALVIYLAASLANKREAMRLFSVGFLPHLIVAGVMCMLVLKQPDLGTGAVLGGATFVLLFVAGTRLSYILVALLAAAPVAYQMIVGTPWRMRRVLAFLDPWAYRNDAGYQISESLISVGSGGLTGLGLGDGKQKLFFLPAAHTDFIFAQIGEELGLIGLVCVVLLFLVLIARGIQAAYQARDLFGTYLAFGITIVLALQALMHMCVVLGLVPTKGITLPLVSYGGSALVTTLFTMGVLLNISARMPEPPTVKLALARAGAQNRRRLERVAVQGID